MQTGDVVERYRRLRAICTHHQNEAMDCVAHTAIFDHARRLGLAEGGTLLVDEDDPEMQLIYDLALHTAKPGRSRAIVRHARRARCPAGSDDARVLQALCEARFSFWKVERRHAVAGVVVTDLMLEQETWLLDEAMAMSATPGDCFAGRLCRPDEFAMTCLSFVPMDRELLDDVFDELGTWLRSSDPRRVIEDARFAASVYRAAVASGIMDNVVQRDEQARAALAPLFDAAAAPGSD